MEKTPIPILQGTLDLMILRTLATLGPRHAYGIAARLEQVSDELLKVNQGTLYPALVRLEQNGGIKASWGKTESNREAKYYAVTKAGLKALEEETQRQLITKVAGALKTGGSFLFTSPEEICSWTDGMSDQLSLSLGYEVYKNLMEAEGLVLTGTRRSTGDNFYYFAQKR